MMRWGRNKPISFSSSGLSGALPVSWYSKFSGSSDLKTAKEKKQDNESSQSMSAKSSLTSSTKPRNDIHERSKRFERVSVEKEKTPRIQDKQKCERRDQKLLEQEDAIRTGSQKPAHLRQRLRETKIKEVKLKADQQRKSLCIKRELNNNVRVFSPRASEKCRVKAIEDLKKAKLRAREYELAIERKDGGGMESESFAVVKCSSDPRKDFRDSMIEMIMENGINHPEELKELLVCYLRLNTDEYHDMIIEVFQLVHNDFHFRYFCAE